MGRSEGVGGLIGVDSRRIEWVGQSIQRVSQAYRVIYLFGEVLRCLHARCAATDPAEQP